MVKVGNICVGHYGYSMEIYNFYVVVKMTDKSITLEKIEKKSIGGDGFRPVVVPDLINKDGETHAKLTGERITRRLSSKSYVNDQSGYGIIYIDNPISEERLVKGYQEDYLD